MKQFSATTTLERLTDSMADYHMRKLFDQDSGRFDAFSMRVGSFLLDYSKNQIDQSVVDALITLAHEAKVDATKKSVVSGSSDFNVSVSCAPSTFETK